MECFEDLKAQSIRRGLFQISEPPQIILLLQVTYALQMTAIDSRSDDNFLHNLMLIRLHHSGYTTATSTSHEFSGAVSGEDETQADAGIREIDDDWMYAS
jgi:hypothetical protein